MQRSTASVRLLVVGVCDKETQIAIDMTCSFGLSIQRADDIPAALELLRSNHFDLVMIDIGIDASEFATLLREERMAVPILACGQDPAAANSVARIGVGTTERSDSQDCTHAMVGRTVAAVERDLILATLQHCQGNRTHAADILGISIRTMRNKLRMLTAAGIFVPAGGRPVQQREIER